ncbi:MAG TPA: hypothetical protein VE909_10975 [Xanthobacteraceae bacterium]|nr:hypothetical protein [Xanthobacteraceae bacterium]
MLAAIARAAVPSVLLCLVAACGSSQISAQLTNEALRASGKGVFVIAVRLVSTTMSTSCDAVRLTRAGDGRDVDVMLSSHLLPEPAAVSGSVELDPGTYAVTLAMCSRPNVKFVVKPADERGMATISIGPGEVVDGGTLIIIEIFQAQFTQYFGKSQFSAIVTPDSGGASASLNRELAGRLIKRPMTAIDPPPPDVLARMCEYHREQARSRVLSTGTEESPLCQLIRPRTGEAGTRRQR